MWFSESVIMVDRSRGSTRMWFTAGRGRKREEEEREGKEGERQRVRERKGKVGWAEGERE